MKAENLIIAERRLRDYNDAVRNYKQMLNEHVCSIATLPFGAKVDMRPTMRQLPDGQDKILTYRWHDLLWDKCRELAAALYQLGIEDIELPPTPEELRSAKVPPEPAEQPVE